MKTKPEILSEFSLFSLGTGGIGSWLTSESCEDIFIRLAAIEDQPLPAVQLNQLLVFGHEAPVSDAFFQYYWLRAPDTHPYNVRDLPDFAEHWLSPKEIVSLAHLRWGLYRLYVDALLFFGNLRTAFRSLRDRQLDDLERLFALKRVDTEAIERRDPPLPLMPIAKDNRYLISEMACKSYGDVGEPGDLRQALLEAYAVHAASGHPPPTVRQLLDAPPEAYKTRQGEFRFSADEVLDEQINSEGELITKVSAVAEKFSEARQRARLKEALTDSVVRLQTNDRLLSETFWNHYHKDRDNRAKTGVGRA
jgi:hypothetical protein